jgi:hypothetical protein
MTFQIAPDIWACRPAVWAGTNRANRRGLIARSGRIVAHSDNAGPETAIWGRAESRWVGPSLARYLQISVAFARIASQADLGANRRFAE